MKPDSTGPERSPSPAPGDTVSHPAEASLWEQFLSRGNLPRRSDVSSRTPVLPGIDGTSTQGAVAVVERPLAGDRSALDAGTYRPSPLGG